MPRRKGPVTVLVYDAVEAGEYARHVAPRRGVTVRAASTPREAEVLIGEADVVFGWNVPASLWRQAPRLAWVQSMGAGVDWALVPALPKSVRLTRVPGIFGPWMAEYALGWCLWVTQRMAEFSEARRERRWLREVIPRRLAGTTMAIVGLGDVGRAIARAATGLGMRVIGVSLSGRPARGVRRVYRSPDLARALAEADFAVVTVPLTPLTRGLVGRRELAAMRPTAWLMNIARGPVVDETALVEALRTRRLAGAILDVFTTEPLPAHHPLWGFENVVITPHVSGPGTPAEVTPVFNRNLARYLAGQPLHHTVDRKRGY